MSTSALIVSSLSLIVSIVSLSFAFQHYRPIVSVMVKTHGTGGDIAIPYDLVVLNSGNLPARNIRVIADEAALEAALGPAATDEGRERWFAAFRGEVIHVLHNNESVSCSFGKTGRGDAAFWMPRATIPIVVEYERWLPYFGLRCLNRKYREPQVIRITDSSSFTGYWWGDSA